MKLGFKEEEIVIKTKNYGKVKANVSIKNKVANGYLISTIKNKKIITGYVDLDFNEIIEFEEQTLSDLFYNDNYNDVCFGFKIPSSEYLEYCHVKKQENNKSKLVFRTGSFDNKPLAIRKTEDNNYWLIESLEEDTPQYAVYDIKINSVITAFFDMIEFVDSKDSTYHSIFYQKNIFSDLEDTDTGVIDRIDHTVLCGFLASDGSFSSEILDQEKELLFDPRQMGYDTKSIEFSDFINTITNSYIQEFMEKDNKTSEYINYLFNNPTIYNNSNKRLAKVYSFNDRKKV